LLAFSRKEVLAPVVLDVNAVLAGMDSMLRGLIGEDIELGTIPAKCAAMVKADCGQFQQVIMNLVVNARDAMPQGGKLTLEVSCVVLDRNYVQKHPGVTPGPHVMLSVTDTGHGMDAETQSHIFEPFFTTKRRGKGTGLGLSTVYGIVDQAGGHLLVYSEPGVGTTFKIYMPRLVDQAVDAIPTPGPTKAARPGVETVLLVEDEESVRTMVSDLLIDTGYKVLEARHGIHALEVAAEHQGPIHLLITDVVMPQMGGGELAQRLTALRPGVRVLFMSGYTDDAIVRHGVLERGTAFIQKPFSLQIFTRRIREVLDAPDQLAA
ncbi:MAG: ATP-binding protein, partial [Actinobacteria bacterium]|nr:ATP-binding protein [Actinomycetota bacterium]